MENLKLVFQRNSLLKLNVGGISSHLQTNNVLMLMRIFKALENLPYFFGSKGCGDTSMLSVGSGLITR